MIYNHVNPCSLPHHLLYMYSMYVNMYSKFGVELLTDIILPFILELHTSAQPADHLRTLKPHTM